MNDCERTRAFLPAWADGLDDELLRCAVAGVVLDSHVQAHTGGDAEVRSRNVKRQQPSHAGYAEVHQVQTQAQNPPSFDYREFRVKCKQPIEVSYGADQLAGKGQGCARDAG